MAKITDNERIQFNRKISPYRKAIEVILREEQEARVLIKKQGPDSAFKRLDLSDAMLNLSSNYLVISGIYQSMQNIKNEDALNEARKALYKSVIYLEEVVSNAVDAPFSDYEERLKAIASVSPAERYFFIRKMGLTLQLIKNAYGDNTKWKWAFVELEGRYAAAAKNIVNLRMAKSNSDPRSPHYEPTILHLRLVRNLLMQAANRYREKYELSTNRIDDFKKGISFLSALRRFNLLTDAQLDAATVKKRLDIWTNKLTADINNLELLSITKG